MSKDSETRNFALDFMVGGVSTAISKTLTAPIQRIKILLQTKVVNTRISEEKKYKGIIDCIKRVPKEEGISAFWRGNIANLIRYFPSQALNFLFHDSFKKIFNPFNPQTDFGKFFLWNLASGAAAGAATLSLVYPLDFLRIRLGADVGNAAERQFTGNTDLLKQVLKIDGIRGLYRGFGITIWGTVVYRAFYFGCYDTLMRVFYSGNGINSIFLKFGIAQMVTLLSMTISYPFDTVKSALMMQSGESEKLCKGTIDCVKKIYKLGGVRAFFNGFSVNLLTGIGGSLLLVFYDELKMMNKVNK